MPNLFLSRNNHDLTELYNTTLLEETLSINENTLKEYVESIKKFWDEFPEILEK